MKIEAAVEADASLLEHLTAANEHGNTYSEVVMVLPRPDAKVLVSAKAFYPPNTFRLPTGKVHAGESPEEAFAREVMEETGFHTQIERKIAEIVYHCAAGPENLDFTSHVFLAGTTTSPPHPTLYEEQITEYREVDIGGLRDIAARLRSLTDRWRGWGAFRAVAHDVVADYMEQWGPSPWNN